MKFVTLCLVFFCIALHTVAQQKVESDSLEDISKREKLLFPFVVRSLETDWGFGGVGALFFKPRRDDSLTRTSDINLLTLYTLRKQLIIVLNSTVFFPHEDRIFRFQSSYSYYPDDFWGLGNYTKESAKEGFSQKQFFVNPQFLQRVHRKVYIGLSYEFQHTGDVTYTPGGVFDQENIAGRYGGNTSGIGPLLTWDSRNQAYSPTSGFFSELQYIVFKKAIGSDFNFTLLNFDLRKYIQLAPSSVLALQGLGGFAFGTPPFRKLEELGGPDMMRGYYGGRFTDKCLMAYQAELRQHLFWRLGCVFFGALGQVGSHVNDFSLNGFHYSYGTGVRFALSQKEKLNLRIDYGIGKGSNALTLQLREAF